MSKKKTSILRIGGFAFVAFFVFVLFKQLNDYTGYAADDYLYHFFFQGEMPSNHLRHIHNLLDLIQSIQNHTRLNNGRFVAHSMVQLFMQWPKSVYNVANSIVFILVGALINLHVFGSIRRLRVGYFALTFAMMWIFLPDYGSSILWLSGGFNYLWVVLVYLIFLLPYRFNYHAKHPLIMFFCMIVLGFLTGATNENVAPITLFVAFAFTVFDWRESQLAWKWAGGIAGVQGFLILVLSGMHQIARRGDNQFAVGEILRQAEKYSGMLLLTFWLLALYLYCARKRSSDGFVWRNQRTYLTGILCAVGGMLGIVALVVSPEIVSRNFFGPNIYFVLGLLCILYDHAQLRQGTWLAVALPFIAAVGIGFFSIPQYTAAVRSNYTSYRYWRTGDTIARRDAKRGIANVKVPGMPAVTDDHNVYFSQMYVANGNPKKQWFNAWMAAYYGVKTVSVDNSIKPLPLAVSHSSVAWKITHYMNSFYMYVTGLFAGHNVQADGTMRTAYLLYVDVNGKKVGTDPISGNVGTTFDISNASVTGYSTLPGNPQSYRFTQKLNQTLKIRVQKNATMQTALIKYRVRNSRQVVATEPISGNSGSNFDISHASTLGYTTLKSSPQSYQFTKANIQSVTVWVRPAVQSVMVYYLNGKTQVGQQYFKTHTGSHIKIAAPVGYRLLHKTRKTRVVSASGLGPLNVQVRRQKIGQRILQSVPLRWLLGIAIIFVVWDNIAEWRIKHQN